MCPWSFLRLSFCGTDTSSYCLEVAESLVWVSEPRETGNAESHARIQAVLCALSKVPVLEGHDLGLCLQFLQVFVFVIHYILSRSAVAAASVAETLEMQKPVLWGGSGGTRQVVGRY